MPNKLEFIQFVLLLACGTIGGVTAWYFSMPLPFMLGGLSSTMIVVSLANRRGLKLYFPRILRMLFISVIGTMIGSTFSPEIISLLPTLLVTLTGLVFYVTIAHVLGYQICRRVGHYDKVTAFYSSMPGGFVEAVILGERGGGDIEVLTLTHFLRLVLVVMLIPSIFYLYLGHSVGSSAGQSFSTGTADWLDIGIICLISLIGLGVGRVLHIPAGHLLGPMLLAAIVYGSGGAEASNPTWLLFLAQLVVGVGLGTQLNGANHTTFKRIFATAVIIVAVYLTLSLLAAFTMSHYTDVGLDALFLSYTPGGVTEMGLIALSMALSPMVVSGHHVFRIFLTVGVAALSTRWFKRINRSGEELP